MLTRGGVKSEKWKVKSEECSQANELGYVVKSDYPILAWGLLRSVVGAICKSPYVGAWGSEKWRVKSEEWRVKKWLSHIGMRAFAFCRRGDLQIALCWHVREWRSEKWKVKSEECSQANELGYVVKSDYPILAWGLFRSVVGAICKSPYVGTWGSEERRVKSEGEWEVIINI